MRSGLPKHGRTDRREWRDRYRAPFLQLPPGVVAMIDGRTRTCLAIDCVSQGEKKWQGSGHCKDKYGDPSLTSNAGEPRRCQILDELLEAHSTLRKHVWQVLIAHDR